LPTAIDYVATDLNSSNGSVPSTTRKSWFTMREKIVPEDKRNSPKISLPSVTSLSLKTTEEERQKIEESVPKKPMISRKILMDPSPELRKKLGQWFGAARWTYNQCVATWNKHEGRVSFKKLRRNFVNSRAHKDKKTEWLFNVPYEVRHGAFRDFCEVVKIEKKKRKKDPTHEFKFKFRSRKDASEAILLRKRCFNNGRMYPTFTDAELLKFFEALPEIKHDMEIVRSRLNDYYVCIPEEIDEVVLEQDPDKKRKIVALDPGVRCFQTGYDYQGKVIEFAPGDIGRIYRLCYHMDKLQGKAFDKEATSKQRYNRRRAWLRMQEKMRNLVSDVHRKTAKYLCENYEIILLPTFATHNMVCRARRKIGRKTARAMMTWSFYKFRKCIENKARTTGSKVCIVSEAYTTKTCGRCGRMHDKIGGNKEFKCPSCGVVMGRDENAPRNILLRNLDPLQLVVTT
jgi:putative transposase